MGSKDLPVSKLHNIINSLPPESNTQHVLRKTPDELKGWDSHSVLLGSIIDAIRRLEWTVQSMVSDQDIPVPPSVIPQQPQVTNTPSTKVVEVTDLGDFFAA